MLGKSDGKIRENGILIPLPPILRKQMIKPPMCMIGAAAR